MPSKFVVASCAATFGIFDQEPVERLRAAGCEVRINPYGRPLTPAEIIRHGEGAQVLVLGNDHLDATTISGETVFAALQTLPIYAQETHATAQALTTSTSPSSRGAAL